MKPHQSIVLFTFLTVIHFITEGQSVQIKTYYPTYVIDSVKNIWSTPILKENYYANISGSDTVKNGTYKRYHETSDQLKSIGKYTLGKKDSTFIDYYEHGVVKWIRSYKNDQPIGDEFRYSTSGSLEEKTTYSNITAEDVAFFKFKDNNVKQCEGTLHQGVLSGKYTEFHPNGKIKSQFEYVNGQREGNFKVFHENGNCWQEGKYKAGKLIETLTTYYPSGAKKSIGKFENGIPNGNMIEYYESQVVKTSCFFHNDTLEGDFLTFYVDGHKDIISHYLHGRLHGEFDQFYDEGTKKIHGTYQNGIKEGTWHEYASNGVIIHENNYSHDLLDGNCLSRDEKGVIRNKLTYRTGKKSGKQYYFYPNGSLHQEKEYNKYSQLEKETEYHLNGKVASKRSYRYEMDDHTQGKVNTITNIEAFDSLGVLTQVTNQINQVKHGLCEHYLSNGNKFLSEEYAWGKLHGERTVYDSTSRVLEKQYFDHGKKSGNWFTYYRNGELNTSVNYVHDKLEGLYTEYLNKNIIVKGQYFHGKKEGEWKFFDQKGNLIRTEKYKKDELITTKKHKPN